MVIYAVLVEVEVVVDCSPALVKCMRGSEVVCDLCCLTLAHMLGLLQHKDSRSVQAGVGTYAAPG